MSDVIAVTATDVCELWLSRCLTTLNECGSEPITASYVALGALAWDTCCGVLVAAPERVYRTTSFPIEGSTDDECEVGMLAVDVVVVLLRCVPSIDDRGNAPSPAALNAAHVNVLKDAALIWNTVTGEPPEGWMRAAVTQTFIGAQGGCIAVETRLSIGLPQTGWCPECLEVP